MSMPLVATTAWPPLGHMPPTIAPQPRDLLAATNLGIIAIAP
jgi:hypothetical protein